MSRQDVTFAQVVGALAVSYKDPGIVIWLASPRPAWNGKAALDLILTGQTAIVADAVAAIGDCRPARPVVVAEDSGEEERT